jgi:hypothetical protein
VRAVTEGFPPCPASRRSGRLTAGTATVTSAAPLSVESVRAAVDEAGYGLDGGGA